MTDKMIVMLASMMPADALVDFLDERIQEYKRNPSKQRFEGIVFASSLIGIKHMSENDSDDPIKALEKGMKITEDIDEISRIRDMMKGKLS